MHQKLERKKDCEEKERKKERRTVKKKKGRGKERETKAREGVTWRRKRDKRRR